MENLICLAYTFIEFDKSFNKYFNDPSNETDGLSFCEIHGNWQKVKVSYSLVSESMSDLSIQEAKNFIIKNF